MPIHASGENYLEAIHILGQQKEYVRSVDLANYLGFSKPTISVAVHTLERNGFIEITSEGHLLLTDSGMQVACAIYERHQVLTQLLTAIGVPEEIAMEDACKLEHDISDISFSKIKQVWQNHLSAPSSRLQ